MPNNNPTSIMKKNDIKYSTYIRILTEELIPAMGCTEPIAIAYAAAKAREILGMIPDHVKIGVSNNIIKNVRSVVVPNTNGMKGIKAAAAAGIVAGNADLKLEVISKVSEEDKADIRRFLEVTPIEVVPINYGIVFDIIVEVSAGYSHAKVRISQYHTNIVYIEKDGNELFNSTKTMSVNNEDGLADKSLLNLRDIMDFAETCDINDVKGILDQQIQYNSKIAEEGISNSYGANIGSTVLKFYGNDTRIKAIAMAAAGSDARMSGCELPVIINSGSGNQGIAASVPVIEYARDLGVSEDKLYRALVISNLTAVHEKTNIGRLSAFCGAVSAGCAAGCGIAYLNGGDYSALAHTLVNSLAIVSGIICDGAKPSCAAKIATSVSAGIFGYDMYRNGQTFKQGDGIVTDGVEATIHNVGLLGSEGMRETDKEIVKLMMAEKG